MGAREVRALRSDVVEELALRAPLGGQRLGHQVNEPHALQAHGQQVTMVQELTDLPICIDSSVVEALEARLQDVENRLKVAEEKADFGLAFENSTQLPLPPIGNVRRIRGLRQTERFFG